MLPESAQVDNVNGFASFPLQSAAFVIRRARCEYAVLMCTLRGRTGSDDIMQAWVNIRLSVTENNTKITQLTGDIFEFLLCVFPTATVTKSLESSLGSR